MKHLHIFNYILVACVITLFASCSKDDNPIPSDELDGLRLVTTVTHHQHKIYLYTASGKLQTGYNALYFQIKDTDGRLVNSTSASWTPVMHMMNMSHASPASPITKKEGAQSTYGGYIVFQMASNDAEGWELELTYTVQGTSYVAKLPIEVTAAPKRVVESFQGSDDKRYVLALVEPTDPRVAVNDIKAVIYRMESMMDFVQVDDYTLKIDPRMPGMGNHGSPNNVDLIQGGDGMYHGKLSLTMTGYWRINLQLADGAGDIVKGEVVGEDNEGSSIYFELEF